MEAIGLLVIFIISSTLYFLPSIIAFNRGHINKVVILILNLFLGWTLVGWIISLIWALTGFTLEPKLKYSNPATELEKLHDLHQKGILTSEEYEKKKTEILNS